MFRHRDMVRPLTYPAALAHLRVVQRRAGVSEVPGLHGIRVTGNNLSRNANGDEITQVQGGWLSVAGRSRYDRFGVAEVLSIPARMLGRPPPDFDSPSEPRQVLRYAHLARTGPGAGDAAQRLVLPANLSGAVLTGRARPAGDVPVPAPGGAAPDDAGRPVLPAAAPRADHELDSDARGNGVLLPDGYSCLERVAANPRGGRSRMWKEYFAPDGTRFQSRAAAWRHAAAADAADVGESSAGVADADRMFQPVAGESPGSVSDGDVPLLELVSGAPSVRRAASLEQVDPPASVGQRPSGLANGGRLLPW